MIASPNKRTMNTLPQTEYTDIESVCAYLGIDVPAGSSDAAEEITENIQAASREMDRIAGRRLVADEETEMTFDGQSDAILHTGDIAEVTSIEIDGVALGADEYAGYPRNKGYFSRFALIDRLWPLTRSSIVITGYFGMYKEVPVDLKRCATILAAGMYQEAHPADFEGEATSESIGNYKVTYTTPKQKADASSALSILNSYKRIAL